VRLSLDKSDNISLGSRIIATSAIGLLSLLTAVGALAEPVSIAHLGPSHRAFTVTFGKKPPKYANDFKHFQFANPDAPKGGTLRVGKLGGFDSLNFLIGKGDRPFYVLQYAFQSLFYFPADDRYRGYPLLAESCDIAQDLSWMVVNINPMARWSDGSAVTADDVAFTFERIRAPEANARTILYYSRIESAEPLSPTQILFRLKPGDDSDTIPGILTIMIQSKKFYSETDPKKGHRNPPLGSGPYRIVKVEENRSLVLERNPEYWAADLPTQKGLHNFDRIELEFFKDDNALFEVFKAGLVDFFWENRVSRWFRGYSFSAVESGQVLQKKFPRGAPGDALIPIALHFNLTREKFKDIRVREAISKLYEFDWVNRVLFHDWYHRANSFFFGSKDLVPNGRPTDLELNLLNPLRALVPDRVFGDAYVPEDLGKDTRRILREAYNLFEAAGFKGVRTKGPNSPAKIIDPATGKPLVLSIVTSSYLTRSLVMAGLVPNLRRFGIEVTVSDYESDMSGFQDTLFRRTFDLVAEDLMGYEEPGMELKNILHSAGAKIEKSINYGGISDPAVDALVERVISAKTREDVEVAAHALDRVLMWNFYFIPMLSSTYSRLAHWNQLSFVPMNGMPLQEPGPHWWQGRPRPR